MKDFNTYITEKLQLRKVKNYEYEIIDVKDLDELEDWVHNEWDGESSFLIPTIIPTDDLDELCEYIYELESNEGNDGKAEYYYEPYDDDYNLLKVEPNDKY